LSWKQLHIHNKPIILFNIDNYWTHLTALIDKTIDCKFTGENIKDAYIVVNNINELKKVLNINVKN
jgi:predicted Rossmann-fold nucleotide-binding protein